MKAYYTTFVAMLSLEAARAAYRDCRAARAHARNTKTHRDLGMLEDALIARIAELAL